MRARLNSPATRREHLLELLASRTYADAPWTDEELGTELCASVRTVQRWRQWLRDTGRLPRPKNGGPSANTNDKLL